MTAYIDTIPRFPVREHVKTMRERMATLSDKERREYYRVQTEDPARRAELDAIMDERVAKAEKD